MSPDVKVEEMKCLSGFERPASLLSVLRKEWIWWISGSVFSFFLASVLVSGWPAGLLPELSIPYTYQGDGLFHSWMAQRSIEGWVFDNPRSGYPFGSDFRDYPGSDAANLFVQKVIGLFGVGVSGVLNLYFLIGFALVFIASYGVLRTIGLSVVFSFSGALLFDFIPFHFQRIQHLFYTWYFVAPLFFYFGFVAFYRGVEGFRFAGSKLLLLSLILFFIFLSSFGVYYSLFGVIVILVSGVSGWIKNRSGNSLKYALAAVAVVCVGVLANVSPSFYNKKINGANVEVAVRSPVEAEVYGLKMMQLVIPHTGHRIPYLANVANRYNSAYPLINENVTASLGVVGSVGFVLSFLVVVFNISDRKTDTRYSLLSLLVLVLFLFGTIGGFGALFSGLVSSSIRGWNRISVFIAFGSIALFFLVLERFVSKFSFSLKSKSLYFGVAAGCVLVGIFDQTVPACPACIVNTKNVYESDRDFVARIEGLLPQGAAIYQLPYMPFPEVPPRHRLNAYDLMVGVVNSKMLRWSYGGMKGRPGDLFFRDLAKEPIEKQLDVVRRLGFSGIYIDRRGYEDNAQALIAQISSLLGGPPVLSRADDEIVFFRLDNPSNVDLSGLTGFQIMQKAGYVVDKLGPRYPATFSEGIDFTRKDWPDFVRNVSGLSDPEPWGRWSDANVGPFVRIDFNAPLPPKFTLILDVQPFGPNVDQNLLINIGAQVRNVKVPAGPSQIHVAIDTGDQRAESIEFHPSKPTSPQAIGVSADNRKLGVGFIRLRFEE